MQHSFPAELRALVAKEPEISWEAACQAEPGLLPEGLVPSPRVSRSWAPMLHAAGHPPLCPARILELLDGALSNLI